MARPKTNGRDHSSLPADVQELIEKAPREMYDLFAEPELSAEEVERVAEAEQRSRELQARRRE